MPHPFSFRSQASPSPLVPASLLDRAERSSSQRTPQRHPGREEIERRIAARRRREARERHQDAAAGAALAELAPAPLDTETQLYNRDLAQQIADAKRIDGIAPILKNALEHEPEAAEAQIDHLATELWQRAPEQADALERELQRDNPSRGSGGGSSRLRIPPPASGKRQGEFYRSADDTIQEFIDFAEQQGLYEILPSDTREALATALDTATLLPGPGKILVFAEFATLIAPAIGHVLEGDLDAAARATTDAMIFLPAAMVAGRRGGKLAVAGSRQFRTGGELPSPTPLAAGAAVSQAFRDGEETLDLLRTQPYEAIENPPSSSPPPQEPLPPEQRKPYREELVPPDLEELLSQIPPTPGFTLADKDDIVEIFPDQRDEIPPILVVESYPGMPHTVKGNEVLVEFIESMIADLKLPLEFGGFETHYPNWESKRDELPSRKGSNDIDFSFVYRKTGCRVIVNTVDTLKNQISPDSREYKAELRILKNKEICDILVLIPKAKPGQIYNLEAIGKRLKPILEELPTRVPREKPQDYSPNPLDSRNIPEKPVLGEF